MAKKTRPWPLPKRCAILNQKPKCWRRHTSRCGNWSSGGAESLRPRLPMFHYAMRLFFVISIVAAFLPACLQAGERINHAGRVLGPTPVVTNAILFNTPEADAVAA